MTTTVTVKTHDWPVAVEINDSHTFDGPRRRSWGHSNTTEFVAAHSEASYAVTDTRTVTFRELPKDAKSLVDEVSGDGA